MTRILTLGRGAASCKELFACYHCRSQETGTVKVKANGTVAMDWQSRQTIAFKRRDETSYRQAVKCDLCCVNIFKSLVHLRKYLFLTSKAVTIPYFFPALKIKLLIRLVYF
jgi:hypothetical protein